MTYSGDELTKHLPGLHNAVEVMEDSSSGRPQRVSEFVPDGLGVDHRPDGCLARSCGTNTDDAKILEIHAELSPLDIRVILPVDVVRWILLSGDRLRKVRLWNARTCRERRG